MTTMRTLAELFSTALLSTVLALPRGAVAERVSKVVVYPDRAQVTRVAQIDCSDKVLTRFVGIPPAADAQSVRAQVDLGGAQILGVRTEVEVMTNAFAKQVEELDDELRRIDEERNLQSDLRSREQRIETVASRYEDVAVALLGRELTDPPGSPLSPAQLPKAWSVALDAPLKVRLEHAANTAALEKRNRELQQQRDELAAKRQRLLSASSRRQLNAEVLVACPAAAGARKAQVELSYFIGGAGFSTEHEARLRDGGSVELTSYATISQRTGEAWRDAQIIISTAVPRQNATPPELVPLRITATDRPPPKRLLVSRVEEQLHLTAGESMPSKPSGGMPARDPERVAQGLSVQFVAPTAADIPGDGTPVRLRIARTELRGAVVYRTIPKLQPFVFRVADLVNSAEYPLLAGPIDLFRKGQFAARYDLPRVAAGERFELSFGLLDRVKVKRKIIEEIARDKGIFGTTRRHRYAYRFEVESYLPGTEEIELLEHIPVSELDDVKVALDAKATPGYELRAADGIVSYKLRLAPGERRAVELHYYVDAPASMLGE